LGVYVRTSLANDKTAYTKRVNADIEADFSASLDAAMQTYLHIDGDVTIDTANKFLSNTTMTSQEAQGGSTLCTLNNCNWNDYVNSFQPSTAAPVKTVLDELWPLVPNTDIAACMQQALETLLKT